MPNRVLLRATSAILISCALASCGPKEPTTEEIAAPHAAATPDPAATQTPETIEAVYDCPPGRTITVVYNNAATPQTALVTVDGQSYAMTLAMSASGARYVTSEGRSPGMTLIWWNKGDEGMLLEGRTDGSVEDKQIASCTSKPEQ